MESLESFYQGYTEALETKIKLKNSKKPSQRSPSYSIPKHNKQFPAYHWRFLFCNVCSCEYVKVPAAEKRRTDIVRIRNIVFRRGGIIIPHDSPDLHSADFVSITFEMQKKDEKSDIMQSCAQSEPGQQ